MSKRKNNNKKKPNNDSSSSAASSGLKKSSKKRKVQESLLSSTICPPSSPSKRRWNMLRNEFVIKPNAAKKNLLTLIKHVRSKAKEIRQYSFSEEWLVERAISELDSESQTDFFDFTAGTIPAAITRDVSQDSALSDDEHWDFHIDEFITGVPKMSDVEYNQLIMGLDDPVTFSRIVSDNAVSNDSDIPRPLIPTTRNTSKDLIDQNPSPPSPQRQTSLFGLGLDNINYEDDFDDDNNNFSSKSSSKSRRQNQKKKKQAKVKEAKKPRKNQTKATTKKLSQRELTKKIEDLIWYCGNCDKKKVETPIDINSSTFKKCPKCEHMQPKVETLRNGTKSWICGNPMCEKPIDLLDRRTCKNKQMGSTNITCRYLKPKTKIKLPFTRNISTGTTHVINPPSDDGKQCIIVPNGNDNNNNNNNNINSSSKRSSSSSSSSSSSRLACYYASKGCKKTFGNVSNKNNHQRYNCPWGEQIRRYKCQVPGCGKAYKRETDLKNHFHRHHYKGTEALYPCPVFGCQKCAPNGYTNSQGLRRHIEKKHPKYYESMNSGKKKKKKN